MAGNSSPKANAARRRNAILARGKGGRPPGPPEEKLARKSLLEYCREHEVEYATHLAWLALNSPNHAVRVSALGMLLDRSRGKPPQAIEGTVSGVIQIMIHPDLLPDAEEQGLIIDGSAVDR